MVTVGASVATAVVISVVVLVVDVASLVVVSTSAAAVDFVATEFTIVSPVSSKTGDLVGFLVVGFSVFFCVGLKLGNMVGSPNKLISLESSFISLEKDAIPSPPPLPDSSAAHQ
jgi:hypothetical protein